MVKVMQFGVNSGQMRSNSISLFPIIFFWSSLNLLIFGNLLGNPFWVYFQILNCFQVFQILSNFFLKNRFRCGNSVDFLYGGLIVRVSSCLSAFRSFALHTFFQITWLNLEQTMGPYIRAKYVVWFIPIYSEHGKRLSEMGK